ncbi:hypothetical protein F183_A02080 [Bryobacterales bacterium F-183]|nr:hypothetical protein F183_A02080 [Bryobacterales bacterium F-183]
MKEDLAAIFNMFLDPAESMKRVESKWIWVIPTVLISLAVTAMGLYMAPLTGRVMLRNPPEGMTREAVQQALPTIETFSRIGAYASPIIVVVMTLISAALLLGACQILGLSGKFGTLFNLVSMASIIQLVKVLASIAVLYVKSDDIQTMQELQPSLGLDIFLPEGTNRVVYALLNYFSIFQVWYIVVLAIAFAAYTKTSKSNGFLATAPTWILPLIFVVGGAFLRPS